MEKKEFDILDVLTRIEEAVATYPRAALFELAAEGYGSPFQILVACIISIRTLDEVTLPLARALFERAPSPQTIALLPAAELDGLIRLSAFHEAKARQIIAIARRVVNDFDGQLPCDGELLRSLPGVGPKCANLVLGIACGQARVSADVHVHRVTNRWGYVATATPEATILALEVRVPPAHWVDVNRLLMPFGKHICTGRLPHCSTCPVLEYCRQVGVGEHR